MSEASIFYSWQDDRPKALNRHFIKDCLKAACKQLVKEDQIEDSPRIEQAAEGVSGTPDITQTIFSRINNAAVFVADVSFIVVSEKDTNLTGMGQVFRALKSFGKRNAVSPAKSIPNPNVVLELGYAAHSLGWDRIVCVMNTAFGDPKELIFDLRNRRWPVAYCLREKSDASEVKKALIGDLKQALAAAFSAEYEAALRVRRQLNAECVAFIRGMRNHESFANAPAKPGSAMTPLPDAVINRLLEEGLIFTDVNANQGTYGYHWTHLGRSVGEIV